MRAIILTMPLLLLAGCSGSSDTSSADSSTTAAVRSHDVAMAIGNGNFELGPAATSQTFSVKVPANATGIQIALSLSQYAAANLHGDLAECGAFGEGGGITIGSGGQTYSSELCDELPAGSYELTIAIEQGTAAGTWTIKATLPMVSQAS